jgi:hypothetical protein
MKNYTRHSYEILEELRNHAVSDTDILEYILVNFLSEHIACDAMKNAKEEFLNDFFHDNEEDDL